VIVPPRRGDDERRAARSRHPANGWAPNTARLVAAIAARLSSGGHPWPELAAAVLADRGRLGLDRTGYAARTGLGLSAVVAAEDGDGRRGALPAEAVPSRVRRVAAAATSGVCRQGRRSPQPKIGSNDPRL
jgi:hypothetical protein